MGTRRPLAEDLADSLVDDILDGRYAPNSVLPSEMDLAEMSGISRLTVREAIKALCAKRVLRVEHGRGTFVNPPEQWSVLDPVLLIARSSSGQDPLELETQFLEARRIVEIAVARMAEERHTEDDLERMRTALARMRSLEPDADHHIGEFVEADIAFHQAIMEAAGNPFIAALFEPMSQILYLTRTQTSAFDDVRRHAIASHQRIYDAFVSNRHGAVVEEMALHLEETEVDLRAYVGESGGSLLSLRRKKPTRIAATSTTGARNETHVTRSLTWDADHE